MLDIVAAHDRTVTLVELPAIDFLATVKKAKMPRPATAAEVVARLKASGRWDEIQAQIRRNEEERAPLRRALEAAEKDLVSELASVGVSVTSVWDLVNGPNNYAAAVPILLAHLMRPYPFEIRSGIARSLALREAKVGWNTLLTAYRDETSHRMKDELAVAVCGACTRETLGELIALLSDRSHGRSRVLLLPALTRYRDPRGEAAMLMLKDDPDLALQIERIERARQRRKNTSVH